MRRVSVLVVVVGLILAGCGRAHSAGEGTLHAYGDVIVGNVTAAHKAIRLSTGDLVTVRAGSALVDLPGGGRVELRTGSSVQFRDGPQIQAGDLLAESGRTPVRIGSSIADVTVAGAARLHREFALEVGTYRGTATVQTGRNVVVPALNEDTLASSALVPQPVPLHLNAADAWDQRFLGTAIELTNQLDSASRYVTGNAARSEDAAFYRADLQPLATTPSFTDALLRTADRAGTTAPGDALVAASIALAGRGDFATRFLDVFSLRSAGAQWGIVALDQAADPETLLNLVERGVQGATAPSVSAPITPFIATGPAPITTTPASSKPPTQVAAGPTTTAPAGHRSTRQATTTTTPPPVTAPSLPLGPVLNPISNLIKALLGPPSGK